LGAVFSSPVIEVEQVVLLDWLHQQQIRIVAVTPEGERPYTEANLQGPLALVMGSEAFGVDSEWLAVADVRLQIPMVGLVDSLNLSVATAVVVFEALRQRKASKEQSFSAVL
jgi:TrmH family RNA methyltransferase